MADDLLRISPVSIRGGQFWFVSLYNLQKGNAETVNKL